MSELVAIGLTALLGTAVAALSYYLFGKFFGE